MQPDETLGTLGRGHEVSHADGRSVCREDAFLLYYAVELGIHLFLDLDVLNDGFHDQVAIGEILLFESDLRPICLVLYFKNIRLESPLLDSVCHGFKQHWVPTYRTNAFHHSILRHRNLYSRIRITRHVSHRCWRYFKR